MKNVLCVKKFFKSEGLNWTGLLATSKDKDFRPATEEDFEVLQEIDYLIDFGKDGQIALMAEIDLINFKINGIDNDVAVSCYPGDKNENKKLCKDRDLTKKWIQFQMSSKGLVFATMIRDRIDQERKKVVEDSESRIKKLEKKIEFLSHKIEDVKDEESQKLKELTKIEKSIKKEV